MKTLLMRGIIGLLVLSCISTLTACANPTDDEVYRAIENLADRENRVLQAIRDCRANNGSTIDDPYNKYLYDLRVIVHELKSTITNRDRMKVVKKDIKLWTIMRMG